MSGLSLATPIMGSRPAFDPGVVFSRMYLPDDKDRRALAAIKDRANRVGIDPAVATAQFLLETDNGTSPRYANQNALAGVGITADDTVQPFELDSVEESADLFIACLYALVHRKAPTQITLSGDVKSWFDRVWMPKVRSGAMPDVRTVADLGLRYVENGDPRATWSWEKGTGSMDAYGTKLVNRLAEFYPSLPAPSSTPTEPEEPMPTRDPWEIIRPYLVEAYVDKTGPGYGYSAGNRTIVALAEHETQGEGSGEWYEAFFECPNGERCTDALVDFLIPQRQRKIYMFNNPYTDNRIPYASGGSAAAITQLAVKASRRMGSPYGGVNAFYSAVEIVKRRGAAMDADQIEMTACLLAFTWAMRGYPLNDCMFPDEFGNEVKTSVNHSDLYTSTNCRINDDDRAAFEQRALVVYGAWLGGGEPAPPPTKPTYAPAAIVPALVPYMTADPGGVPAVIQAEGSEWIFVNDRVTVARATTPRLQRADPDALRVGGDLKKGETFTAKFMVRAVAGDWYYLTAMFTRVQVRHTARLSDVVS